MLTIEHLWKNHPAVYDVIYPCSEIDSGYETPNFENQCAIRMSVCLERAGIDFSGYNGVKCWFKCEDTHTLRVEELVPFLRTQKELGVYKEIVAPKSSQFSEFNGIIVCYNFWNNKNGDHIDLVWGGEMTYGDLEYVDRSERVGYWELP
jgi:hypothetical protein